MGKITQEELNKMIKNHRHWLRQDCEGWEDMRANLLEADLRRAELAKAKLAHANFTRADLVYADLRWADLRGADLRWADLRGADLSGANLAYANLEKAILVDADLAWANLIDTNFTEANLTGANHVDTFHIPVACPTEGSFIGWKKANGKNGEVIVKLLIPEDARRSSATSRKCRCDKAKVLSIESLDKKTQYESAYSQFDCSFVYEVGKEVTVPDFCKDRFKECAQGIHFFINREEAMKY